MSTSSLVNEELQPSPTPSQPAGVAGLGVLALVCAAIATLAMVYAGKLLRDYNHGGTVSTLVGVVLVAATVVPWIPSLRSFGYVQRRAKLLRDYLREHGASFFDEMLGGSLPAGVSSR